MKTDPTITSAAEPPIQRPLSADHHLNNFDFLRFLFASLVLWYHCFPLLLGDAPRHAGIAENVAGIAGGASVAGFFVISGFLVTASWQRRPNLGHFIKNRALRIYPAFLVCSLFCALVVGPLGADNAALYWRQFHPAGFVVYLLLLVGPYIPPIFLHLPLPIEVDGSFWTLRYEFECYLLVAVLGIAGLYRRRIGSLVLWSVLFLLLTVHASSHHLMLPNRDFHIIGNPTKWLPLAVDFSAGMMFYLYREIIPHRKSLFFASLALLGLACLYGKWLDLAGAIAGPYALFFIAFSPSIKLHNFARYGDFSYGIYLFAFPIQQLLIKWLGAEMNPIRLFFAAFSLTLLCAAFSWHFVERPCLMLKTPLSRKRKPERTS